MTTTPVFPLEGGCDCGYLRYRIGKEPLFVHCCHCRWCQRESGSAFAVNALLEADHVADVGGTPQLVHTPSASGRGQEIARCPRCHVAVWSHYGGAGPFLKFVRVGTLDTPDALPPDIHIYTSSRQPWVALPADATAVPEYYRREEYWPYVSLARFEALLPHIREWRAAQDGGA